MYITRHSEVQKPGVAGLSVDKNPDKSAHRRREPNCMQNTNERTVLKSADFQMSSFDIG
jgi:hypothetical protein